MKINKISNSEFSANLISSLPIRPNVSSRYGKAAMSGDELKEMFDKNSELLRERINAIIDYISNPGDSGIASEILTGVPELPTLKALCEGILDGSFAATLTLTDEYTLLDFATKLMNFVFPENSIEFIKLDKINGVYALPDKPYENHESAVYLLPSSDTLSLFDCYIWDDGWQLWSTGSLQGYISTLEEIIHNLWEDAARVSDISYLKSIKADEADVFSLSQKIDAMCSGSPIPYQGTLEMLQSDLSKKTNVIYLITDTSCPHYGCWCFHDGAVWRVGGDYVTNTNTATMVQKYDPSPVSSGAVKRYIDEAIADALDGIGRDYSGDINMFDKYAITQGLLTKNGSITKSTEYIVSDYIDITTEDSIYCSSLKGVASRQALYPSGYLLYELDETPLPDSYLFQGTIKLDACITIDKDTYPSAQKIRLIFQKSYYDATSKVMVNGGTTWRKYSPYRRYVYDVDSSMNATSNSPVQNKAIYEFVQQKTHSVKWQFGSVALYPVFDTQRNKLIFNRDCHDDEWGVMLDGKMYRFVGGVATEIDISPAVTHNSEGQESNKGVIYLNTSMLAQYTPGEPSSLASCFSVRDADFTHTDKNALPIATFRRNGEDFCAWMDCPFYIDNKLFGVCADTAEIQSQLDTLDENIDELLSSQQQTDIDLSNVSSTVSELSSKADDAEASISKLTKSTDELDTRVGGLEITVADADAKAESALSSYEYVLRVTSQVGLQNSNATSSSVFINGNDKNIVITKMSLNGSGDPFVDISFDEEVYNNCHALRSSIFIPAHEKAIILSFFAPNGETFTPFLTGDDCTGGAFTPQANTEYSLFLWRCGKFRCHVIASR